VLVHFFLIAVEESLHVICRKRALVVKSFLITIKNICLFYLEWLCFDVGENVRIIRYLIYITNGLNGIEISQEIRMRIYLFFALWFEKNLKC
jgi:hypothetical protein